jgi:hypothetical protein
MFCIIRNLKIAIENSFKNALGAIKRNKNKNKNS